MAWLVLVAGMLAGSGLAADSSKRDLAYFYRSNCAACHGVDGSARGTGGVRLPGRVLANAGWMGKQEDQALIRSIREGKGAMPSFKEKLAPDDCNRLLVEILRPMTKPVKRGR